jgi:hypothetical protein
MTQPSDDLTVRPMTGLDELDLFCRIPYVLNAELAGDLWSAAPVQRRAGARADQWRGRR